MQISRKKQKYIAMTAKLDAMSPLKVLTRGYAMAQKEDGQLIRTVNDVQTDDAVMVSLSDGMFRATVMDKKERVL